MVTAATVSAFTIINREAAAKPRLVYSWVFMGDEESQILQANQWQQRSPGEEECGTLGELPCTISVEASSQQDLATYFSNKDEDDILNLDTSRKP